MTISDKELVFPVLVYTYNRSLIDNPQRVIDSLNQAFSRAKIKFELDKIVEFEFPEINKLTEKGYKSYYNLTEVLDVSNRLCIWVVPSGDVCDKNGCSATSGFSNINGSPGNIAVTDVGWKNTSVVVHEMGHWFGLDHTTDDEIEDTPYDPGAQYSVYISYDDCEMHHPDGYKPMIENFMSYYGYCPSVRKRFTPMQLDLTRRTAQGFKTAYVK